MKGPGLLLWNEKNPHTHGASLPGHRCVWVAPGHGLCNGKLVCAGGGEAPRKMARSMACRAAPGLREKRLKRCSWARGAAR